VSNTKKFAVAFLATLLAISSIPLYLYLTSPGGSSQVALNRFQSYEELKTFIESASSQAGEIWMRSGLVTLESGDMAAKATSTAPMAPEPTPEEYSVRLDYSETNVQVEGVDEADIVKTDGEYIYIVSGNNVTIVKAYPPEEARVLSKISLDGWVSGIFINGDKLAVFETSYGFYPLYDIAIAKPPATDNETEGDSAPEVLPPIRYEPPTTSVKVYDISDRANPKLTRDFAVDGSYFSSRMIGDYVYVVATQYAVFIQEDIVLPRVHKFNETEQIPVEEIYYYNFSDTSYSFTTIAAVNIMDDSQEPTHETILLGGTSTIYVSMNNIYLTFPDYSWQEENPSMKTTIQRIAIDKQSIKFAASGEVPGYVLNQFSMDEHNGYFRIATTTNNFGWRTFAPDEQTQKNNVYVLDMNLNVVGSLEGLAPGEQIYSARFMGNRCYLVTFRKVDPLFVIDLSDPIAPKVLGQLKITGYSGYLHPYDENHLIGIGKEAVAAEEGDFAWYQGVKISLFDVSDVSNPKEITKFEIGDRGTDSPALHDHKAVLFDRAKNLLVLPVLVAEIDPSQYGGEVPDWAYGEAVWQGAYVFNISLDGLELKGRITHIEDGNNLKEDFYYFGDYEVKRSLYIDNVLYTISNMKLKMNSLDTLVELNTVALP